MSESKRATPEEWRAMLREQHHPYSSAFAYREYACAERAEVERLQTVLEFAEHAASTWIDKYKAVQADLYEGNCELEKQQRINRELANGPYVIANSPQMVKDYIDAGAVTDGMVVIIQSKLKEVSDE